MDTPIAGRLSYRQPPPRIGPEQETHVDRTQIILRDIDRSGLGLEIGPSHNPIAPRSGGFNVEVVDHLDRQGLLAKYAGHPVDLGRIEEVDHVWQGQPLSELIGATGKYDWIIASHVIEHVPDLAGFLAECALLLRQGGTLSLAVPDKRFCFDNLSPLSSTGDVLQARLEGRRKHPPGLVFDHFASAAALGGDITWREGSSGKMTALHTLEQAIQLYALAQDSGSDYIDIHAWRFTPSSFRLLVGDLCRLGVMNLGIHRWVDTVGFEFFVSMRHVQEPPAECRVELARLVNRDLLKGAF